MKALENEILLNLNVGKVIQGTDGPRKMRFAASVSRRGKSGGFRVCYLDFTEFGFGFVVAILRTAKRTTFPRPRRVQQQEQVRATREVFGLSQPLFAQFLGVDGSALRHWEQGSRSPSAIVRLCLDEMNATPDH